VLDGLGIETGGDKIFRTSPDRLWGPPSLLYKGYRVFPEVKERLAMCNSAVPLGLRGLFWVEVYCTV